MADVKVESNASEVARDMRTAAERILATAAAQVAEASIAFNEDMRGPGPGMGLTPFRTGNLQSSGRTEQNGVRWSYVNDARPYRPSNAEQGQRVTIMRGRESYASFARFAGEEEGQFSQDAQDAFEKHFGPELEDAAERALMGVLDV